MEEQIRKVAQQKEAERKANATNKEAERESWVKTGNVCQGVCCWTFFGCLVSFSLLGHVSVTVKVPMVLTGAYKYLQTEFAKQGLTSSYSCIVVHTSLANIKNAHE